MEDQKTIMSDKDVRRAISRMTRPQIEDHLIELFAQNIELKSSLEALRSKLNEVTTVDLDIVEHWRAWIDTLDKERDDWARQATASSIRRKKLEADYDQLETSLREVAQMADTVLDISNETLSSDGRKMVTFRSALKKIIVISTSIKEIILGKPVASEETEETEEAPEEGEKSRPTSIPMPTPTPTPTQVEPDSETPEVPEADPDAQPDDE